MSNLGENRSVKLFEDQLEYYEENIDEVSHLSFNQHVRKAFDKYLVEEFDFETERNVT